MTDNVSPHFLLCCMMITARLAIAGLISACGLISCATAMVSAEKPENLNVLNVDPLACTGISLRTDVPITRDVIHEPSVMLNRYLIVLRYREGGDEKEFTSDHAAGYNNVSLVSEVAEGTDNPLIVFRRYCVIEMWKFFPEKNIKHCYLWVIGDDSTNMKVMLEGFGGEFLDERIIPLTASDISELKSFFLQLIKIILDKVEESIAEPVELMAKKVGT
jgi:hypothetical protein